MSAKNIFDQLVNEHNEVKKLLKNAHQAKENNKLNCILELERAIVPHARAEERTIYSMVRKRAMQEHREEDITLANEAYDEHRTAEMLLAEIKDLNPSDHAWQSKFGSLKETLEHHIQAEEDEFFDVCKDNLTEGEQEHLLVAYLEAKEKFEIDRIDQVSKKVVGR